MGDVLQQAVEFMGEPGRWSLTEPDGIPFRIVEHLWLTLAAMLVAMVLTLPPAVWLAHHHRAEALASSVVNIGRAIPSFGLIILFWLIASRNGISSNWALVAALVALAIPPLFTNAYTGVAEVDPSLVESARGQGLTDRQVLFDVELPLATEVILTGVRIAMVQVIATVGIGAIVYNGGGLGRFIIDGFAKGPNGYGEVMVGAILLAALVLVAEGLFSAAMHRFVPRGLQDQHVPDEIDVAVA